jgi:hypothetical protein
VGEVISHAEAQLLRLQHRHTHVRVLNMQHAYVSGGLAGEGGCARVRAPASLKPPPLRWRRSALKRGASPARTAAPRPKMQIDGLKQARAGAGGGSFANDPRAPGAVNAAYDSRFDRGTAATRVFLRALRDIAPGEEVGPWGVG